MEEKKGPKYRIKLYRYQKLMGFEEEEVVSAFYPAMVDGFAVLLNTVKKVVK